MGSATLAWIQGLIFLAFAPLAGVRITPMELIPVAAAIFLISFTLTGLGFVIAWKMNSTAGFHGIMNLLLVPMWMVSGSLFPMSNRARLGEGDHVGQPADLFHRPAEPHPAPARTHTPERWRV